MDRIIPHDPKKQGLTVSTLHPITSPVIDNGTGTTPAANVDSGGNTLPAAGSVDRGAGIMPAATIDNGSASTQYAQPATVPMMRDVTKPDKAAASPVLPLPTAASGGMSVTNNKLGVQEVRGSGPPASMVGLNPQTMTPQGAAAVDPTARMMSPGDLVGEALNRMPLGVRKKDQPAMLSAIMQGMTGANNAMGSAGGAFAEADLKSQAIVGDSRNDLAANINAAAVNSELGAMKNETDLAQLTETKRHNKAAEGIDWFNAKHKGGGGSGGSTATTLSRNIDQLIKSGVAKDAKEAWALLNGKKGGRDDFVSKVVTQGITYAERNMEDVDIDSLVTRANTAADKLYGREQSAPAAPNVFDGSTLFHAQQGITTPQTNMLRDNGIKAKRPSINTFYN